MTCLGVVGGGVKALGYILDQWSQLVFFFLTVDDYVFDAADIFRVHTAHFQDMSQFHFGGWLPDLILFSSGDSVSNSLRVSAHRS